MAWAGEFIPPNPGPLPFRLDQVPLDIPMMHKLSDDLTSLASAVDGDEPEKLRARAQILALAMALDSQNRRAKNLIERLESGRTIRSLEDDQLASSRRRLWHALDWLEQEQAGNSGRALALCMADVMRYADEQHPKVKALSNTEELGRWGDWVAPVYAFHDTIEPDDMDDQASDTRSEDDLAANTKPNGSATKPTGKASLVSKKADVMMPVWTMLKGDKEIGIELAKIQMNAWVDGSQSGLTVHLPSESMSKLARKISGRLQPALEARHGTLPEGLQIHVSWPGYQYRSDWNGQAISGAVAVLAEAALSGKKPNAFVYAELGEGGKLELAPRTWETLRAFAKHDDLLATGTRLILPSAAEEIMPYLLTTDRGELFFDLPIWGADNFESMADLAMESEPDDATVKAEAALNRIKENRGTRSFGGYVATTAINRQLVQFVQAAPRFYSARMLALRGTSNWPRHLNREIYASEARAALMPLTQTWLHSWLWTKPHEILQGRAQCLEQIRVIERLHASTKDRDDVLTITSRLISLFPKMASTVEREHDIYKRWVRMKGLYYDYLEEMKALSDIVGDTDFYPSPAKQDAPEIEDE